MVPRPAAILFSIGPVSQVPLTIDYPDSGCVRASMRALPQNLYRAEVDMAGTLDPGGWLFGRSEANKAATSRLCSWIKSRGTSQQSPAWERLGS